MRRLTGILARCAGVREDSIGQAPFALQGNATLGALLIVLGMLASMTWGYATQRLFLGDSMGILLPAIVGTIGGLIVFLVDRSLALSIDKQGPRWKIVSNVLGRALLAGALAWTMSMPVILRFSRTILATHLFSEQNAMTARQFDVNAARERLGAQTKAVDDLAKDLATQDGRLAQEPDSSEYQRARGSLATAERNYMTVATNHATRMAAANREIQQIRSAGEGMPADNARIEVLQRRIEGWRSEVSAAAGVRDAARSAEKRVWQQWQSEVTDRRDQIKSVLARARVTADETTTRVAGKNAVNAREIQDLLTPNLAREYQVFSKITSDPKDPDAAPLNTWALALHGLFFLLELMPLILKLTWPRGPIDDADGALNALDSERINLHANAKFAAEQARNAAWIQIQQKAFDDCAQKWTSTPPGAPIDLTKARRELDDLAAA